MKKYYITSGELRYLQSGLTMLEACDKALKYAEKHNIQVGNFFCISEQGWRNKLTCQWFYKINSVRAYLSQSNPFVMDHYTNTNIATPDWFSDSE